MEKTKDSKVTARLTADELKKIKMFCLQNDATVQDFVYNAIFHCMEKKIIPK